MEKAYITGATGAIGMALVSKLLSKNVEITVFLRRDSSRNDRIEAFGREVSDGRFHIEYTGLEGLADYGKRKDESGGEHIGESGGVSNGRRSGESCDVGNCVFYHMGWSGTFGAVRGDRTLQQKNIEYTCDAVRLAARLGCRVFVGAGSQAEYGRAEGVLTPDMPAYPENEYGLAKLEAGKISRGLAGQLGISHYWVRILSVYGPYDGADTMVMSTIRRLIQGQEAELTQGIQTWDYLYCEDAAEALYLIGERGVMRGTGREAEDGAAYRLVQDENKSAPKAGMSCPENESVPENKIYCLASGRPRRLRDYIIDICDAVGADRNLLKFGAVPYADGRVMNLAADISRLKEDTGYVPHTEFAEGISKTAEWCRRHYLGRE